MSQIDPAHVILVSLVYELDHKQQGSWHPNLHSHFFLMRRLQGTQFLLETHLNIAIMVVIDWLHMVFFLVFCSIGMTYYVRHVGWQHDDRDAQPAGPSRRAWLSSEERRPAPRRHTNSQDDRQE